MLILTGSGLPIPEELPIVAAGIASSVGTLNPWGAFFSCLAGALAGDAVIYFIGYHFGYSLITRYPRFAHLLHAEREARIEQMIRKHGLKVFFLSRFMVGIRAPVYLTAGILRMSFRRFLLIDAFCATCVVGLFFGLSHAYGERVTGWIRRSEIGVTVIVVLAAAIVLAFFWLRHYRRHRAVVMLDREEREPACTSAVREPDEAHH